MTGGTYVIGLKLVSRLAPQWKNRSSESCIQWRIRHRYQRTEKGCADLVDPVWDQWDKEDENQHCQDEHDAETQCPDCKLL
jgi:hypothetical protein